MRRMCNREKITCVPAEPMSMPTLVSEILSWSQRAFCSTEESCSWSAS
jgi:hypothetical protein